MDFLSECRSSGSSSKKRRSCVLPTHTRKGSVRSPSPLRNREPRFLNTPPPGSRHRCKASEAGVRRRNHNRGLAVCSSLAGRDHRFPSDDFPNAAPGRTLDCGRRIHHLRRQREELLPRVGSGRSSVVNVRCLQQLQLHHSSDSDRNSRTHPHQRVHRKDSEDVQRCDCTPCRGRDSGRNRRLSRLVKWFSELVLSSHTASV